MHAQTKRQREVLDLIVRYIDAHGYRPSYQTIARHLGLSSRAGIARIVNDLESQGLLTRKREDGHFSIEMAGGRASSGGIQIEWLDIPDDGEYRESWQNGPFSLPEFMLGYQTADRIRAFRVTDDALSAENIVEDDVALIELHQFARDGERVVAVLNNTKAVLRRYYRSGAEIELRPADADVEIIRLSADRIEVLGIFRGLIRPII